MHHSIGTIQGLLPHTYNQPCSARARARAPEHEYMFTAKRPVQH